MIFVEKFWSGLLIIPIMAYDPPWTGHFFIENNKPATFKYPWWSLLGDYKMCYLAIVGKLKPEMAKIPEPSSEK